MNARVTERRRSLHSDRPQELDIIEREPRFIP